MVIVCIHMPQRNRGVRYTEVLSEIAQCGEALADGFIIVLGDFNCFVPEHPETIEFLDTLSAELVVQRSEGRLHKDWVATDYTRICLHRVSCEAPVADHPCILRHFMFTLGPWVVPALPTGPLVFRVGAPTSDSILPRYSRYSVPFALPSMSGCSGTASAWAP